MKNERRNREETFTWKIQKQKTQKNRNLQGHHLPAFPCILFPVFLCFPLSKTRPPFSLSFSVQRLRQPIPATSPHSIATDPHCLPRKPDSISSKNLAAPSIVCNVTETFPTPFPATTGHHIQRHNDQKNHHDLLYPKVLTVTPFFILENPPCTVYHPCICMRGVN